MDCKDKSAMCPFLCTKKIVLELIPREKINARYICAVEQKYEYRKFKSCGVGIKTENKVFIYRFTRPVAKFSFILF